MEDELFENFFIERLKIDKQRKENQKSSSTSSIKQYFPYHSLAIKKRMMFGKKFSKYFRFY
jgi:hypothetical protein